MAIDFGRMARGVATGYLSAKIANTEANDKMNANIIEAAGLKFHQETYPEYLKKEEIFNHCRPFKCMNKVKQRKKNYRSVTLNIFNKSKVKTLKIS